MELRDYLAIGRKWLWLFVLATVVAAASAWVATQFMPRTYRSQTTLMVGRAVNDPDPNYMNLYLTQSLAETYAQMTTRQPVLEHALNELKLKATWHQLKGLVQAKPVPGSQLVEISVIDTDPVRSQVIADQVAKALIFKSPTPNRNVESDTATFIRGEIADLQQKMTVSRAEVKELEAKIGLETSARAIADLQSRKAAKDSQLETWRGQLASLKGDVEGSTINSLEIIEEAATGTPVGPNVQMNVLLAALIGFGLALGAALALEYMDDTVKSTDQVERRLGLTGLATIEVMPGTHERKDTIVALTAPRSPVAEAFRSLRTNLQFSLVAKHRQALLITSANPGEGKSTVAGNLAVVLAQKGTSVILVDADLRRPAVHRAFGLPNSLGMTSLLLDDHLTPDDALRQVEAVPGLSILTSGPLPPNPAEVLDSEAMNVLIGQLRERADILVFDSPPILAVTDAAVLATRLDGTVLVFDAGTTRVDVARRALAALQKVGVAPLGAVVNRMDRREGRYYTSAYRYNYDYSSYYGPTDGDSDDHGGPTPPTAPGRRAPRPAAGWVARLRETMTSFLS